MIDAARQPRTFPKARALVAGLLFLAWIVYLAYLVWRTQHLVVVSRPQALVSDLIVLAAVEANAGTPQSTVHITRVLWTKQTNGADLAGLQIELPDLTPDLAYYSGPGAYILPLIKTAAETYRLTPLPAVPGFVPREGETRIYPATDETLAQVESIIR